MIKKPIKKTILYSHKLLPKVNIPIKRKKRLNKTIIVFKENRKLTNSYVLRKRLLAESCWIEFKAGIKKIVIAIKAMKVILIKIIKLLLFWREKFNSFGRRELIISGLKLLSRKAIMQIKEEIKNIWYPRIHWIIRVLSPSDFWTAMAL